MADNATGAGAGSVGAAAAAMANMLLGAVVETAELCSTAFAKGAGGAALLAEGTPFSGSPVSRFSSSSALRASICERDRALRFHFGRANVKTQIGVLIARSTQSWVGVLCGWVYVCVCGCVCESYGDK